MKDELVNKIVNAAPYMFEHHKIIECGDGWYHIIRRLVEAIAEEDKEKKVRVQLVKEKFGGLRFYVNVMDEKIDNLIFAAEKDSIVACEDCGNAATVEQVNGWIYTLCNDCKEKYGKGEKN